MEVIHVNKGHTKLVILGFPESFITAGSKLSEFKLLKTTKSLLSMRNEQTDEDHHQFQIGHSSSSLDHWMITD
jgi:hypothetical protein